VEAEKQIQGWGRRGTATQFCNPKKHATVTQIQSEIQVDRALSLEIDTSIEFAETGYSMYQLEVQETCQSFQLVRSRYYLVNRFTKGGTLTSSF
jgi:hypothetical protein